ncbi:MAG: hypothetical protein Q7S18_03640 [bacterium]|nr:hypothetical protein [bacterium]
MTNCTLLRFKFLLIVFIILIPLFFPFISHASLVPCGRNPGPNVSVDESRMCTLCHLVVGVKGLIDFGFKIMVIIGIVMITIAGVLYIISTGETSMMENAKGMLKNTLIGFAIILGGWLMVNTLMWVMGTRGAGDKGGVLGINVTNWYTFTCSTKSSASSNNQTFNPEASIITASNSQGILIVEPKKLF